MSFAKKRNLPSKNAQTAYPPDIFSKKQKPTVWLAFVFIPLFCGFYFVKYSTPERKIF